MPFYADNYALVKSRSPEVSKRLLERFLPGELEESADEYELPQYSDSPEKIFKESKELLDFLESESCQTQNVNWRSKNSERQAGVYYTNDGAIIICVACPEGTEEKQILKKMMETFDCEYGYTDYENPPPESASEFIIKANKREQDM